MKQINKIVKKIQSKEMIFDFIENGDNEFISYSIKYCGNCAGINISYLLVESDNLNNIQSDIYRFLGMFVYNFNNNVEDIINAKDFVNDIISFLQNKGLFFEL